ncbi:MAG: phosphoribosylglycinamide formyltransferase [Elusimicrobiota bacterium]|jgi:phosphoribosylglycinamide formyltransferase-1|nr:phosphoribosylglycinamide formyltransferase [Elusimicrobiota bacterium]
MKKIAVFVSGGGSNLQSIIDQTKNGILKNLAAVSLVISNNPSAFALQRAKKEKIKSLFIKNSDEKVLQELKISQIDLICLAGYMSLISSKIIDVYNNRILNIHPSLLPKFGGKKMYGHYVHQAVIKAGEKKSGATVHFVDENYDTGKIIIQKEIPVFENDTSEILAKRVLEIEHKIYPEAIKSVILKMSDNEQKR